MSSSEAKSIEKWLKYENATVNVARRFSWGSDQHSG